jgi:hypothetical protein
LSLQALDLCLLNLSTTFEINRNIGNKKSLEYLKKTNLKTSFTSQSSIGYTSKYCIVNSTEWLRPSPRRDPNPGGHCPHPPPKIIIK